MRNTCATWLNWAMTLAVVLMITAPARAFYWYDWPGSGAPPSRTIVGPPSGSGKPPPRVPIGPPTVITNPPPGGGQGTEPGGPQSTPEPTTGLIAIVGFGTLAAARAWRNRGRVG